MADREKTIRGMRICELDEIPVRKRKGLSKEYWTGLFNALKDKWVHVGDLKIQTGYALTTIRIKARKFGFYTVISRDKNWLYIKKETTENRD